MKPNGKRQKKLRRNRLKARSAIVRNAAVVATI